MTSPELKQTNTLIKRSCAQEKLKNIVFVLSKAYPETTITIIIELNHIFLQSTSR